VDLAIVTPCEVEALPPESRVFPRSRNKIKDNPALESIVDEMLWMGLGAKDIKESLERDHKVFLCTDTIYDYKNKHFKAKFERSSSVERAAWKKRADKNIDIFESIYAKNEELVKNQIRIVETLQMKLDQAAEEENHQVKVDGNFLTSIASTSERLMKAQDNLSKKIEELKDQKSRLNAVKVKTCDAIASLLLPKMKLEERERTVILKQIEVTVRTLEIG
jgi:hypothetical protein